jgi:hypothetical protein
MKGKRDFRMRRGVVFALIVLTAGLAAAPAQRLRAGEQALFLKNGEEIVGRIVSFSGPRLTLALADGMEIALRDLWLINFVNEEWNFPQERNLIETSEHYIFLKSGDVAAGRIIDMNGEPRVLEFETGEKFALGQIRRIYFSRTVPRGLR